MVLAAVKRSMNNTYFQQSGSVLRISLVLSLFFHVIAILALQEAFPLHWVAEELRTFRVDLIRPPVEDINPEELSPPDVSRPEEELEPDQDAIALDTKDERYVTYFKLIQGRIGSKWKYPPEAVEALLEGKLLVIFNLNREGELTQIKVKNGSGHEILDSEAIRAITAAAPFPPVPEHIKNSPLKIEAKILYQLKSKK